MGLARTTIKAIAALALFLPDLIAAGPTIQLKNRDLSFDYDAETVYGVNLGGWFVLEPWITPSIFDEWSNGGGVVDEYTLCQTLGYDAAYSLLSEHWNSWITQDDFNEIAAAGLNHVRIPIGYWAFTLLEGDPYVQGQLNVLDQAIGWAAGAGLKVIIDLHGAPGSQNGFDNSGRYGPILWQTGDNVPVTLNVIQSIADRYAWQSEVVTAIELINEPFGPALDTNQIKKFYYDGWGNIRTDNQDTAVVIHDAFEDPLDFWNGFMNIQSGVWHVILDTHCYQIFDTNQIAFSPTEHISAACAEGNELAQLDKWTIVGEWTGAQTDCAKWLNGLGKGARYDGTFPGSSYVGSCDGKYEGTVAGLSGDDKYNLRRFIEAQLDAYERRTGWVFWTWKTESAPEWNLQDLLANGLFPQPLSDRQYPGQCGY
ncbi:MAG: hypothetical protein M1819_004111 [Sarea resinae]|nr:MAG: hypothetical protein M1819_004111 [Sarea resinae]